MTVYFRDVAVQYTACIPADETVLIMTTLSGLGGFKMSSSSWEGKMAGR